MTFLATVEGELVPGGDGPWDRPWGLRCDDCGRTLPYGVVLIGHERRTSRDQARNLSGDVHRCGDCEGFTEQLGLGLS